MQTKCFWCPKAVDVPAFLSVPTGRWDSHVIGWKIWACEACRRTLGRKAIIVELSILDDDDKRCSDQDQYHWLCVDTYNSEPAGYCDGCGKFISIEFESHECVSTKQLLTAGSSGEAYYE